MTTRVPPTWNNFVGQADSSALYARRLRHHGVRRGADLYVRVVVISRQLSQVLSWTKREHIDNLVRSWLARNHC